MEFVLDTARTAVNVGEKTAHRIKGKNAVAGLVKVAALVVEDVKIVVTTLCVSHPRVGTTMSPINV